MNDKPLLIGPFKQICTFEGMPLKGALVDSDLVIRENKSILIKGGLIKKIGEFDSLKREYGSSEIDIEALKGDTVCLPGYIDAHTHICFGGERARDYAMRNAGKTYLEIAKAGGGIWDTVQQTRQASKIDLTNGIIRRANTLRKLGITTIEVKSGYGLSIEEELKMLYAIQLANDHVPQELIATCLAAHIFPKDHSGKPSDYLHEITEELFPILKEQSLTNRIDAFIEQEAFTPEITAQYFEKAKAMGFDITVHADQFHPGGSQVAVDFQAMSADHLEASGEHEIQLLANSDTISMALPGASIGLGCAFTPARKILDAGGSLAIASDWNPGSAPMGDLIVQASILGTFQKLTNAEVLAGVTYRAAAALGLSDRGRIQEGMKADLVVYSFSDINQILYQQGSVKPDKVLVSGVFV